MVFDYEQVSKDIPKILISNMSRLDRSSPTQHDCIESTLNVLDSLLEFHSELVLLMWMICRLVDVYWSNGLLTYLLGYLEDDSYDDIVLHASELFFSLISYTDQLTSLASQPVMSVLLYLVQEIIEKILVLISRWRNHDPDSLQESEIVENVFNSLCLILV